MTKPFSETIFNDRTNILNSKQSLVTLQKYCYSKTNLSKKIEKEATVIDSLSSRIFNSNINKSKDIDEQSNGIDQVPSLIVKNNFTTKKFEDKMATYNNTSMYNNSQYDYNFNAVKDYTQCDKRFLNQNDLSELFQMELNLKMFQGKIVNHLNMLKNDVLLLMSANKSTKQVNKQACKGSNNLNDIIKNIYKILKLNVNKSISNLFVSSKDKYPIVPFVSIVDCNALNILNEKLDYAYQLLASVKLTSNDKMIKEQKKSIDSYDILEFNHSNKSFGDRNSLGSNSKSGFDSFDHMREPNKAIELSLSVPPLNTSIDFNESFPEPSFQKYSMKCASDEANKESFEIATSVINNLAHKTPTDSINHCSILPEENHSDNQVEKNPTTNDSFDYNREPSKFSSPINNIIDFHESFQEPFLENLHEADEVNADIFENATPVINNLSYKKLRVDKPTVSINHSSSFHVENHCSDQVKTNRYSLRICPRPTDHYISPLNPVRKKSYRKKTNNDLFICKGKGQKKTVLQYKIHSVLKANSTNELIKKIFPEIYNREFKENSQNTSFDISNLKSKKNAKPCPCGIFPSQVPSTWSNSVHKLLHQNLYKLQFKVLPDMESVKNVNDNGFIYDIMKINGNSDDNQLQSILKNIEDFINIEVDFCREKNLNFNRSIFLAVIPNSNVIGYLETESLNKASIYQNDDQLSENLVTVKYGVAKLWVMVKYRNSGVATKLLKQFCNEKHLKTNEIAFAHHGIHRMEFIKKFFANNSVLVY